MIGVYIHVPFCVRKCPYCAFYSETDLSLIDNYVDALIRNIKSSQKKTADTIYFGGGTPSILSPSHLCRILSCIHKSINCEITLEANPNSVSLEYLKEIRKIGVNRISFGVQSLNDKELVALGRLHNSSDAKKAILDAKSAGFTNISVDIMIGTALQTHESLEDTVRELTKLPAQHISAYILKIEDNTTYSLQNESEKLPDEDFICESYLKMIELLEKYGFSQYEISNFAKDENYSKHNLKYWQSEEYYGFGPHAHSFVEGERYSCEDSLAEFIKNPLQSKTVTSVTNSNDFEEHIMLSLRLTKTGVFLGDYPDEIAEIILKKAKPLEVYGYLSIKNERITLTAKGCLVSNSIIAELISDL